MGTVLGVAEGVGALHRFGPVASRHFDRLSANHVFRAGRGVRRTAHESRHIGNLSLAMIGGSPVKSVDNIVQLGGMAFSGAEMNGAADPSEFGPVSKDDSLTFGEQFAHIIDWFCSANAAGLGQGWERAVSGLQIEVTVSPWMSAVITYRHDGPQSENALQFTYTNAQPSLDLGGGPSFYYAEKKVIGGPLVNALGAILLSTKIQTGNQQPNLLDEHSGNATSPNENADTLGRASAFPNRSLKAGENPHHTSNNGASATPIMPCVCGFVIPESRDGRCFSNPSNSIGGDDYGRHAQHAPPRH